MAAVRDPCWIKQGKGLYQRVNIAGQDLQPVIWDFAVILQKLSAFRSTLSIILVKIKVDAVN